MSTYIRGTTAEVETWDGTSTAIGSAYVIRLPRGAVYQPAIECPELTKPTEKWQRSGKQRMPKPR